MTTAKPGAHHPTIVTTPNDRDVVVAREFHAPRALVWDAWTSCEHLPHWMLGPPGWTMPTCEVDLRPGGTYRLLWRKPDGASMEITGSYTEVVRPERLVSTERWGGDWPEAINILTLTERGGTTTAHLIVRFPSRQARDAALRTGMTDGMTQSYDVLEAYLKAMG